MEDVSVELRAADGTPRGFLVLSRLPGAHEGPMSAEHDPARPRNAPVVEVREGRTYRYRLQGFDDITRLEPSELFDADDLGRLTGRLSPGGAVGVVTVEVDDRLGATASGRLTVRAAKFADEAAFQSMLGDLAALSVEAIHQGFSASSGAFSLAAGASPRLLYQQFAVLHSLLFGQELEWALGEVTARPHRAWVSNVETQQPGRPLRGSSRLSAALTRPGRRVLTPSGPLHSLPERLLIERTEETLDTIPNQFVRFVLERWRGLAVQALTGAETLQGAPQRRGIYQALRTIDRLDELLGQPFFRQVSSLASFPGDNQVLLRREGHRQISAAAAIVEGSLGLELDLEDPFLVSRRSIATLYEYWTFVRLAQAVTSACGGAPVESQLFKASESGMSLVLRTGTKTQLRHRVIVGGTEVSVDVFFNNTFGSNVSWTRPMRPDASVRLRTERGKDVWLHFDAKYRVEWLEPFATGEVDSEEEAERTGTSKREDLLKMHAYRDAIRNSAAAFVLFPGSTDKSFFFSAHESLPALGAFPMRPERVDEDAVRLEQFFRGALTHVAGAATRHRRATYWTREAYSGPGTAARHLDETFLERPPADTAVLVGYVRSADHWQWIERTKTYNVRSGDRVGAVSDDGPELEAPLLLLYGHVSNGGPLVLGRSSPWRALSREAMRHRGYPDPRGESYLVAKISQLDQPYWLDSVEVSELQPPELRFGQPFVVSWLDVILRANP